MKNGRSIDARPLWFEEPSGERQPHHPPLLAETRADVVVIGGGITGMIAADRLQRAGRSVVLLDLHEIAGGESGHTTAHLTEVIDRGYDWIEGAFGKKAAWRVADSMRFAIRHLAELSRSIDCDFERLRGYLYAEDRRSIHRLKRELAAAKRAGVAARWTGEIPLPFRTAGGIVVENQAQFHPRKFLFGLAEQFVHNGGRIFERTRVTEIEDGEPCRVTTESGRVSAPIVIVATHSPIVNRISFYLKMAAYRTYAVAARLRTRGPARGLYWDVADPYHYARSCDDLWIVGGADHKTGREAAASESIERIEQYARKHYGELEITHRWSGQILEPVDGLPYIGLAPRSEGIFVATGYSGTGFTFGTVAGILLSDLVMGQENRWIEIYDPQRVKAISGAREYVFENKDYPVRMVKDRLRSHPAVAESRSLHRGQGGLYLSGDGTVMAVQRDERGVLRAVNATCTHLGCLVQFNEVEKSWDCPCHGSRFDAEGRILNGPAMLELGQPPGGEKEEVREPEAPEKRRKKPAA